MTIWCLYMSVVVKLKHAEGTLVAEICHTGSDHPYDQPLEWYVDAAWIEGVEMKKVRDLTDAEIEHLDNEGDADFTQGVLEAISEYEENYDPTP